MNSILKILGFLIGLLAVAKCVQLLIDFFYENGGKRYITTDNVD